MKSKTVSLFFLVALFPLMAAAFELKVASDVSSTAYLKWNTGEGAVGITLNTKGSADVPVASVETAVQQAVNAWQNVPGKSLQIQYRGKSATAVQNSSDRINSVQWFESSWAYSSDFIAITKFSYYLQDPPYIVDADILMNGKNYKWSTTATVNGPTMDVQQILIHELGHLIGLAHTSVYNAQMYPYASEKVSRSLNLDDKTGTQYLYGTVGSGFSPITPVESATYVSGMAQKGLPLPVLRWRQGPVANYTLEFSDNSTFTAKYTIKVTGKNYYALQSATATKLESLAPDKQLYWRVCSGTSKTTARKLNFKS